MNLIKLIKRLRQESRPNKKCKKALWTHLDHKFDHMYPQANRLMPSKGAIIAAVVLIVLGTSTATYAYESPEVVEGHPFYFIKQNIEDIEGKMKFNPQQRAEWHLKMQQRRLDEAKHFAGKKDFRKDCFEQMIKEMENSFAKAKAIEMKNQRQAMLEQVSRFEQNHIQALVEIKPQLSQYSQQTLDRMVAEHTRNVQALIKGLEADEQEPFMPMRKRRFMIIRQGLANNPEMVYATSSENIVTADMLPSEFGNMKIIMIQQ